jgi:hypothetical protein
MPVALLALGAVLVAAGLLLYRRFSRAREAAAGEAGDG